MRALIQAMLIVAACDCCLADDTTSNPLDSKPLTARKSAPSVPQIAAVGHKQKKRFYRTLENDHARHLIGMRVENEDGQAVGNLEDFIVDLRSGQLAYALVSSGGFLGLYKQFRILPPQVLSSATSKRGVLELEVGNVRWRRAPRFRYGELSSLANPDQLRRLYHYYNRAPSADFASSTVPGDTNSLPSLAGRKVSRLERIAGGNHALEFASKIFGRPLINSKTEFIGSLSDLLVDLKGQKPVLAVVLPSELFPSPGNFAVALGLLRPHDADRFVIDANRQAFAQAPPLDEQAWPAADNNGAPAIYRSFDRAPSGGLNHQAPERPQRDDIARQF